MSDVSELESAPVEVGTHLPNPKGGIEVTGKDARHIKVKNGKERPGDAIHDAIVASVAHAESIQ